MNKKMTLLALMVAFESIGFFSPAQAQWDLGGVQPNPMLSAGPGQTVGNGNGSLQQPYNNLPSYRTQYNQIGNLQNLNPNSGIPNLSTPYVPMLGGDGILPKTYMPGLSTMQGLKLPAKLKGVYGGLPPTTLDSFVQNAGGAAATIYGDEGTGIFGPPPQNGFPEGSTINAGINGLNNKTLTTGHGSELPTASGNGVTKSGPH